MKHGHKEKGNKAKAKPSGKKSSSQSKASPSAKKAVPASKSNDKDKNRGRIAPDTISFNNPVVASAFRRAVKKYPTAFRRLTD